ncbi:hypothetical protein Tco_0251513 [Tanacetum coccineum]
MEPTGINLWNRLTCSTVPQVLGTGCPVAWFHSVNLISFEDHERGFEFVGNERKNILEVEEGMMVLPSTMIVGGGGGGLELLGGKSSNEVKYGCGSMGELGGVKNTRALGANSIFLGGFLVEEDALEAILKAIKKGVVAGFAQNRQDGSIGLMNRSVLHKEPAAAAMAPKFSKLLVFPGGLSKKMVPQTTLGSSMGGK